MTAELPTGTDMAQKLQDRLRRIAHGNGLEPDQILVLDVKDMPCRVRGELSLALRIEAAPDDRKSKNLASAEHFRNRAEMDAALAAHTAQWRVGTRWRPAAQTALRALPGHGWGMGFGAQKATLPLDEAAAWFEADEVCPRCGGQGGQTCPVCQGRRYVLCTDCHGQKEEQCTWCHGTRHANGNPQEPCPHCQGKGREPCRLCKATGQILCRACQGKGRTSCDLCKGHGTHRLRVGVRVFVEVGFRFVSELSEGVELPRRVKQALQRFGPETLARQNHAVIEAGEIEDRGGGMAVLPFIARLPFAQLRLRLAGRETTAYAFGLHAVPLDIPPFLDEAIKPAQEKLAAAARGQASIESALSARVMHDALRISLCGGTATTLRRPYAPALSLPVAQEMMDGMKAALRRMTQRVQLLTAVTAWLATGLIGIGWFTMEARSALDWPGFVRLLVDLVLLGVLEGGAVLALAKVTTWRLYKALPGLKLPRRIRAPRGWLDYALPLGIALVYLLCLLAAPPSWLTLGLG